MSVAPGYSEVIPVSRALNPIPAIFSARSCALATAFSPTGRPDADGREKTANPGRKTTSHGQAANASAIIA
jgi:hypothetical protein